MIVGRRGGKSRILALIAVYLACFRDYAPYLAPGEVATIGVLAVDKGQARAIFRFVLGLLKAVPMLEPLIVRRDTETIELSNRVHIEIATATFRSTRGYSYAAVLCDEVAFWRSDETSLNPDVEILRALRPGLATIPGLDVVDRLVALIRSGASFTTPIAALRPGRRARPGVESLDAEMNPGIDQRIIERGLRGRSGKRQGGIWRRVPDRSGRLRLARDGRRGDHVGPPRAAARAWRDLQRLRRSVGRRLGLDDSGDRAISAATLSAFSTRLLEVPAAVRSGANGGAVRRHCCAVTA